MIKVEGSFLEEFEIRSVKNTPFTRGCVVWCALWALVTKVSRRGTKVAAEVEFMN